MDTHKLAWAAGLFDGEGCVALQKGPPPIVTINIGQASSPEVLYRFRDAVGFGRIMGPYQPPGARRNIQWQLYITRFEHVQAVLAMMWRWLSGPKRQQASRNLSIRRAYDARLLNRSASLFETCHKGHKKYSSQVRVGTTGRRFRRCNVCEDVARKKKRALRLEEARAKERDNGRRFRAAHPGYYTIAAERERAARRSTSATEVN